MSTLQKPASLNGVQLIKELKSAGVEIKNDMNCIFDTSDGFIHLDIKAANETKAAAVVAAHVGVDSVIELSLDEKLASVGISLAEIKAAILA